jgi:NAD(P)H-dependent FMN reductase
MPYLLTIAGSLRAGSSNAVLLAAAALVAPAGVTVSAYTTLGELPAFNRTSRRPRHECAGREGRRRRLRPPTWSLISTPEYAHGIPGALKNALDWVVGSGELVEKPVGSDQSVRASRFAFRNWSKC